MTCILFCIFFQKHYRCEDCGMYKGSEKQLKKHIFAHKKGLLSCRIRSKQFEDKNHLDEHEDIHVVSEKHYKCLEKHKMVWNVDLFIHIKEAYVRM